MTEGLTLPRFLAKQPLLLAKQALLLAKQQRQQKPLEPTGEL